MNIIKHIFTPRLNLWHFMGIMSAGTNLNAGMYVTGAMIMVLVLLVSVYAENKLKPKRIKASDIGISVNDSPVKGAMMRANEELATNTSSDVEFELVAKHEEGHLVTPKVGDHFVRLNRGSKYEPFKGIIIAVHKDKISINGTGYIGGAHYRRWWGDLLSLEHVTILKALEK